MEVIKETQVSHKPKGARKVQVQIQASEVRVPLGSIMWNLRGSTYLLESSLKSQKWSFFTQKERDTVCIAWHLLVLFLHLDYSKYLSQKTSSTLMSPVSLCPFVTTVCWLSLGGKWPAGIGMVPNEVYLACSPVETTSRYVLFPFLVLSSQTCFPACPQVGTLDSVAEAVRGTC